MTNYEQKIPGLNALSLAGKKLLSLVGRTIFVFLLTIAFAPGAMAQGDCCDQGEKPAAITMKYTGDGCEATSHSQDPDKVQCSGDPNDDAMVYIIASEDDDGGGKIYFAGNVALYGTYIIDAANAGDSRLKSRTFVNIYSSQGGTHLQFVEFHTSCSQPLFLGNQFGANLIENIEFEDGTNCSGGSDPGPPSVDCCDEGDKPAQITMTYTGEDCNATSHSQDPDKVQCSGDPAFDDMVYIIASEDDDGGGKIYFSGNVALNSTYVIDAANAGEDDLKSKTFLNIYSSQGGTHLQFIEFHTSCSQPLAVGNQFGANRIEGIVFKNGVSCGPPPPCENFCDGGTVGSDEDDCEGYDPEIIIELVAPCEPPAPPAPAGDCCDEGDKPAQITMTYTGEDCSATSHSQDPDKVQCEGDPAFDDMVYIIASEDDDGGGKIYFAGNVALNSTYVIDAANAGDDDLKSKTFLNIYSSQGGTHLQFIEFHTSCSQPLSIGNQFGANRIEGIVFKDGSVCGEGGNNGGGGADCCDIGGKPAIITATYTGESCAATSHSQDPGKVQCDGNPNFDDSVYIVASEDDDGGGKIWFSGTVALGETFEISALNAGEDELKSATFVNIYSSQGGSHLQFIEFHTSCSQPLAIGNQFGAVRVEHIVFDDGTTCGPAVPDVEYQWLSSTVGCPSDLSDAIPGATEASYDPDFINQTTYYVRLIRKGGCTDAEWIASNCVVKAVNPPCDPCIDQGGDTDMDGVCDNQDCVPDDPFFPNTPGTPCDDGDPNTENDVVTDDGCDCMGEPIDPCVDQGGDTDMDGVCDNQDCVPDDPFFPNTPGTPCDDGDPNTENDVVTDDGCDCMGEPVDPCVDQGGDTDMDGVCDNQDCVPDDPFFPNTPGTPCDDGDPNTENDVVTDDGCDCMGEPVDPCVDQGGDTDMDGVCDNQDCVPDDPFFPNTPGTPCDDGDPNTENDVVTDDGCDCMGEPVICDNYTDGGIVGLGDGGIFSTLEVCIGENTLIQNNVAPSGGSGAPEVVWIKSPSVDDCNTAFSELLPFNVGQIYDDFLAAGGFGVADPSIGTTSWMFVNDGDADDLSLNVNVQESNCYTRCVRRDGCLTFDGESNIVSIIAEDCAPYTACDNTITLNGFGDANVIQVHDRNAGWVIVYSCGAWTGNGACADPQNINLPDGSYQLRVTPAGHYSNTIDVTINLPASCGAPLTAPNQGETADNARWNSNSTTRNTILGEVKSAQFDLYPNPTKDLVHINMSQYYGKDVRIRVVNELGMEMNYREIDELEEAVLEINTRNYAQGLYLVIVQIEDEAPVIKKLVVTK